MEQPFERGESGSKSYLDHEAPTSISGGSSLSQREKQKKKVDQYSLTGDFIKTWSSVSEAAKAIGGQSSNIASCTAGRRKTAYGYIWRYGNV